MYQTGGTHLAWQVLFEYEECGLLSLDNILLKAPTETGLLQWSVNKTGLDLGIFDIQRANNNYDFRSIDFAQESEALEYEYELGASRDISGFYRIVWSADEQAEPSVFSNIVYVQDERNFNNLILFPNPVTNDLHLKTITGTWTNYKSIQIYNTIGINVFSKDIKTSNNLLIQSINTEGLKPGLHVLYAESWNGEVEIYRFIKY